MGLINLRGRVGRDEQAGNPPPARNPAGAMIFQNFQNPENHFSLIKHCVLGIPGELSEIYRIGLELGSEPEPELEHELEQN